MGSKIRALIYSIVRTNSYIKDIRVFTKIIRYIIKFYKF